MLLSLLLSACSVPAGEVEVGRVVEQVNTAMANVELPRVHRVEADPLQGTPEDVIELTRQAGEAMQPIEQQKLACDETRGRVEQHKYPGLLSSESIPIRIYLPPCYDPFLQVYPLVILLHGSPQDEGHWQTLSVHEVVNKGIRDSGWPAMILVMPYQPEPLFTGTDGGPGSLEQEIMQGLIPYVLDRYAVSGDGKFWAVAGISRGGVWALELSLRFPERFHAVAALSPALNVSAARPAYDPYLILENAELAPDRIFLGVGDADSARTKTRGLVDLIEGRGIDLQYLEVSGSHESATWAQLIPEMFAFFVGGW